MVPAAPIPDPAGDPGRSDQFLLRRHQQCLDGALTYQSLADDVVGPILTDVPVTIAPAAVESDPHRHGDGLASADVDVDRV